MSKIIVYLVGTSLGVVTYLKKVDLSITTGYAMFIIPSYSHSYICLPEKAVCDSLKMVEDFHFPPIS